MDALHASAGSNRRAQATAEARAATSSKSTRLTMVRQNHSALPVRLRVIGVQVQAQKLLGFGVKEGVGAGGYVTAPFRNSGFWLFTNPSCLVL
jgi:hypothetical protein